MARRAKRRTGGDSYEDVKYQINVREGNRLAPVLRDLIGTEDPEDLALDILDVLTEGSKVPQVGNYYVFIYNPKTPNIQYDLFIENNAIEINQKQSDPNNIDELNLERVPHILILSSGDLNPFSLRLFRDVNNTLEIVALIDGTINVNE